LAGLVATPAAFATHGKIPRPPSPNFVNCSSEQIAFLKDSWWEAYRYAREADGLMDFIASRPAADRAELWSRDFGSGLVPSPRRYFGPYTPDRLDYVRGAIDKARRRFTYDGPASFKGINRLRCRKYCAKNPSAFHFPTQEIATCPVFWKRARNGFKSVEARRAEAAHTLVHEMFHWIRVDGKYVVDYHTDGAGPHPNRKYYGIDNVTYLAEHVPRWAIRNNDTYAYFTQAVKRAPEPTFTGIFAEKEGAGTGGMFRDLTWSQLVAKQQELAPGQYLADVETYLRHGERRYTGLWRIGSGAGALHAMSRNAFAADFNARKNTEDLIDVEVYREGGQQVYIGVYRFKAPGAVGDGGLLLDMTWESLAANHSAFAANAYLADVETYLDGDKRRFVGVWRVGTGTGALLRHTDAKTFGKLEAAQNATQQLIDFERYQTGDGKTMLLGVWRSAPVGRERSRERTWPGFEALWLSLAPSRTLIDVEEVSTLPAQVL
jgi:hypothetical protein